jgi:probable rRNA maturation factor
MLRALRLADAELSILVCDDRLIRVLNREHRAKDKPTDVLAFALREGEPLEGAEQLLGDVVLSLPTAARQARALRRPLWDEVTMLLAHGLLHLLGYDHRNDAEERAMNREVARLCAAASARAGADMTLPRVDKRSRASPPRAPRGARKASKN